MSKLSNIITMMNLLSNGKKYSISELSKHLEVSERMIRVYKDDLEKAGIFIDTIRGPYGGYVLNQSIRIPNRKFNIDDLKILDEIVNTINDDNLNQKLNILIDKIKGIYHGSNSGIDEINLADSNRDKYNIFTKAIKHKNKVKILYYSYNKGELERVIHPYDLFLYENGWGLAAFCELRNDIRHFEFKRINKLEILDETY